MFSNDLEKQFGKKFKIVKHPTSFDDNKVVAQYTITEKTETISFTDTLRLNLRGDLKVDAKAPNGTDGIDQKNKNKQQRKPNEFCKSVHEIILYQI